MQPLKARSKTRTKRMKERTRNQLVQKRMKERTTQMTGKNLFIVLRYHLRAQRQRGYLHRLDHQMDVTKSAGSYDTQQQMLKAGKSVPPGNMRLNSYLVI
jgi:hypothetical protein